MPQPPTHLPTSSRKDGCIRRSEPGDASPRRGRIADDEQSRYPAAFPTTLPGQMLSQSCLPVEAVQGRLRVGNHRLHFDDEDDPGCPVEGEDVDRAALAPDRERHFDSDVPTGRPEQEHESVHQPRMGLVQKPIQALAPPTEPNVDRGSNSRGDAPQGTDSDPVDLAALNFRNERAGPMSS